MSVIIVESVGFCATNSISELLRINGKNLVSHGTKNFQKKYADGNSRPHISRILLPDDKQK